jgi:hypothetical protein
MPTTAWKNGAYWAIPMPDKSFGFGRLLTFPYAEFLDINAREADVDAPTLDASRVLFAVAVHRSSLRRWIPMAARTRLPRTDQLPTVFMQNVGNPAQCSIRGPDGHTREARPEECEGLERSAVWTASDVEGRLWDAFGGRTNTRVESLRVKLPTSRKPERRAKRNGNL